MHGNLEHAGIARAKVVDLAAYRAERARQELPLFAQPSDSGLAPGQGSARVLGPSQVEHRERMLRFLGSTS